MILHRYYFLPNHVSVRANQRTKWSGIHRTQPQRSKAAVVLAQGFIRIMVRYVCHHMLKSIGVENALDSFLLLRLDP
jgi:hypothetical protein